MGSGSSSFEESGESMEMATAQGYAASGEVNGDGNCSRLCSQHATHFKQQPQHAAATPLQHWLERSQAFADSGERNGNAATCNPFSANSASAARSLCTPDCRGVISLAVSPPLRFDTYRVGEMDVVTREDAMKIGMESAKQAEANVYQRACATCLQSAPVLEPNNGNRHRHIYHAARHLQLPELLPRCNPLSGTETRSTTFAGFGYSGSSVDLQGGNIDAHS